MAGQIHQGLLNFQDEDVPDLDTPDYLAISVALDELKGLCPLWKTHDEFAQRALVLKDLLESAARDQGELVRRFPKAHRILKPLYHLLVDTVLHPILEIKARKGTLSAIVLQRFLRNYKTLHKGYSFMMNRGYISSEALDKLALKIRTGASVNATDIEDFRNEYRGVLKTWIRLGDKGLIEPDDIDKVKDTLFYLNSREVLVLREIIGAEPDKSLLSELQSKLPPRG